MNLMEGVSIYSTPIILNNHSRYRYQQLVGNVNYQNFMFHFCGFISCLVTVNILKKDFGFVLSYGVSYIISYYNQFDVYDGQKVGHVELLEILKATITSGDTVNTLLQFTKSK